MLAQDGEAKISIDLNTPTFKLQLGTIRSHACQSVDALEQLVETNKITDDVLKLFGKKIFSYLRTL